MPLWILPELGGVPHRVGEVVGRDAAWSPDRQRIAYAKGHELYVCKADGTEARKIVVADDFVRWPRWSPRYNILRFTLGNPGSWTSIAEVSADGGRPQALLPGWKGVYCCGNWTRDGKYYVFQSTFNTRTDIWAFAREAACFRSGKPNLSN